MKQAQKNLEIRTARGCGCYDITREISTWVSKQAVDTGLLTAFIRHTSASLVIQENADPSVLADMEDFFRRTVPPDPSLYRHGMEGSDDMPAHIRSALTQTQISVPVSKGRLALGTWQGIYVYEHRTKPHNRTVVLHLIGL